MMQYKYPGVYTQVLPSGAHTIAGAPTSVALFVGPTLSGKDNFRTRLNSFGDFERYFGGLSATSNLSYSVLHFFANGGGEAYVIRVPPSGAAPAKTGLLQYSVASPPPPSPPPPPGPPPPPSPPPPPGPPPPPSPPPSPPPVTNSMVMTALSSGLASNGVYVEFDPFGIGAKPFITGYDKKLFNLTVIDQVTGQVERFGNLSTDSNAARYAPTVINDPATGSNFLKITLTGIGSDAPQPTGAIYELGALPAAGTFGADVNVKVHIDVRDASGTAGSAASLTTADIAAFKSGETVPTTPLEMTTRLLAAINEELRKPANVPLMQGVSVEGALFEGGTLLRLKTSPPVGPLTQRLYDATVTLVAPSAGTSFITTFLSGTPQKLANASRYQLGAPYVADRVDQSAPGTDGSTGQPSDAAFMKAVTDLDTPDPFFNLLCLPDLVRPTSTDPNALLHSNALSVYQEAARICTNKHAMLLVDPFPNITSVGAAENWKNVTLTVPQQYAPHAAALFPNIRVDDPLQAGATRIHPPSGAFAGLIARTDGQVGPWQAPAGVSAGLSGVYGPSLVLSDTEQGVLNPLGLNVIRQFPIYGTVNFGARTLDGADLVGSEWKYIPVVRTADYILRSLGEGLRWAVMQPNGEQLWAQLRLACTSFMQGLFVLGAFKGVSAQQAYFVRCDASTTSPTEIDKGVVNIVLGFAPLKPAEFVVVSLKQITQSAA